MYYWIFFGIFAPKIDSMKKIIKYIDSLSGEERLSYLKNLIDKKPFEEDDKKTLLAILSEYGNFCYSRDLYIRMLGSDNHKAFVELVSYGMIDADRNSDGGVTFSLKKEKFEQYGDFYIRFGDIPKDEQSSIWRGEFEVGKENGVSVYPCVVNDDGTFSIGITLPITRTSLDTFRHLIEFDNRKAYLVIGKFVGRGKDNEPLLKDIKVVREITSQIRKKS